MKDPFSDSITEQTVNRDILERDVQKQSVDWARMRGYWARKFSSPANRSVPDYLFAHADFKDKFAVEFKRPGTPKKLIEKYGVYVMSTEAQYEEQLAMRAAGWDVYECDNFEWFKFIVLSREKELRT